MDPTQNGIFALAERRLAWADQRQTVLAQNIANADTPGWRPRDVAPFANSLEGAAMGLARTDPAHLAGPEFDQADQGAAPGGSGLSAARTGRPSARQPDGNAVSVDEQLTKVADTETTQTLVTTIYRQYMQMFALALGHGG